MQQTHASQCVDSSSPQAQDPQGEVMSMSMRPVRLILPSTRAGSLSWLALASTAAPRPLAKQKGNEAQNSAVVMSNE